ncbi:6-phosphogluconolactonase [Lysobacter tyrosinilyticus]
MAWIEHYYSDAEALAAALAVQLEIALREAIALRDHAILALAGGRTPLPAYRALATRALDWDRVVLIPTDERCVPHDHPACNLRALGDAFATADGARLVALTVEDGEPERSQAQARATLSQHAGAFDAVVLGMGEDAHTASLFPGAAQLPAALDPVAPFDAWRIDPQPLPPDAPYSRITLTVARLLRAHTVHLALTGEAKHAVLRAAQRTRDPLLHPIAAILHAADTTVHIHWSE